MSRFIYVILQGYCSYKFKFIYRGGHMNLTTSPQVVRNIPRKPPDTQLTASPQVVRNKPRKPPDSS